MIYTDEDKITEDGRIHTDAHFKPDFCPDNLSSANYICHLLAVRTELLRRAGGLRSDFDGSQDHDLALRLSEMTQKIKHLPCIAYHWRTVGSSVSHQHLEKCTDASCRAIEEHSARMGFPCRAAAERGVIRLTYELQGKPRVSLITDGTWESDWPDTQTLRVTAWDEEALRRALAEADGDHVLLLRKEALPQGTDFVRELLMYAQRPEVGMVTPVITDRRGSILHAGWHITEEGMLRCRNRGLKYSSGGWHHLALQAHNVAAVSPVCLMAKRADLAEVPLTTAGIAEACLRMLEAGRVHVYTPWARAVCGDASLLRDPAEPLPGRRGYQDPCYSVHCSERADFTARKGK